MNRHRNEKSSKAIKDIKTQNAALKKLWRISRMPLKTFLSEAEVEPELLQLIYSYNRDNVNACLMKMNLISKNIF